MALCERVGRGASALLDMIGDWLGDDMPDWEDVMVDDHYDLPDDTWGVAKSESAKKFSLLEFVDDVLWAIRDRVAEWWEPSESPHGDVMTDDPYDLPGGA